VVVEVAALEEIASEEGSAPTIRADQCWVGFPSVHGIVTVAPSLPSAIRV
jgi:hypothetical protein